MATTPKRKADDSLHPEATDIKKDIVHDAVTATVAASAAEAEAEPQSSDEPMLKFKVAFKAKVFEMEMQGSQTVTQLKAEIETRTSIAPPLQKLLFKGVLKDDLTLHASKVTDGSRIILMASGIHS